MSEEGEDDDIPDLGPNPCYAKVEAVPSVKPSDWELDNDLTLSFRTLATDEVIVLKEGVWVLRLFVMTDLTKRILVDDSTQSPHLVTRQEQRDVVDFALKESGENLQKRKFVVAVRGSPGIGKSWSTLWYMRKLMNQPPEKRRPILFERGPRSSRTVYLIIPTKEEDNDTWSVYHLKQDRPIPQEWKICGIIDIVIDPIHFSKEETPSPSELLDAGGHIFVPVCSDDRHLISEKDMGEYVQLILGPWHLNELKQAFLFMLYNNPKQSATLEERNAARKTMEELYYFIGGLPRYLSKLRGEARKAEISANRALQHSKILWEALKSGATFFSDNATDKILTRFFTLRAGVDEHGRYNPNRKYATMDFVSPGAVMAARRTVLDNINSDTVWKNSEDSSAIGLAYERVVLVLLAQGTRGMNKLGIEVQCRQLVAAEQKPPQAAVLKGKTHDSNTVEFVFMGSHEGEKIEKEVDDAAFEKVVRESGKGMAFASERSMLTSTKPLVIPPNGYSNVNGMVGADLGLNATLQLNHSISGLAYIRQRREYGLKTGDKFSLVFVVPPHRFKSGWRHTQSFSWEGEERKKRKFDSVATAQSTRANKQAGDNVQMREDGDATANTAPDANGGDAKATAGRGMPKQPKKLRMPLYMRS